MEDSVTTLVSTVGYFDNVQVGQMFAVFGAVFALVLGGLGSSFAIKKAGQKAAGVLAEKPNLFGSLLVMTSLPGSQGVYGLLAAIMILLQTGLLGGEALEVSTNSGLVLMLGGLIVGGLGFATALLQGSVVAASIGAIAKEESISGKAVVLSAIIETYAIFGLLLGLFLIFGAMGA